MAKKRQYMNQPIFQQQKKYLLKPILIKFLKIITYKQIFSFSTKTNKTFRMFNNNIVENNELIIPITHAIFNLFRIN